MTIVEKDGKLFKETELSIEEIESLITEEEESIKETLDKIEKYRTFLPAEELDEEDVEGIIEENSNHPY